MNTNKIYVADPYNETHIKLFTNFEEKNNKNKPISTYLSGIKKAYDKSKYEEMIKNYNDFNIILFTLNGEEIKDYCYIKGEKDRKICELFFAQLKEIRKLRPIMDIVSNYILTNMGMEQVFVSVTGDEKILITQLCNHGFENIGEFEGTYKFIKEKEDILEVSKIKR